MSRLKKVNTPCEESAPSSCSWYKYALPGITRHSSSAHQLYRPTHPACPLLLLIPLIINNTQKPQKAPIWPLQSHLEIPLVVYKAFPARCPQSNSPRLPLHPKKRSTLRYPHHHPPRHESSPVRFRGSRETARNRSNQSPHPWLPRIGGTRMPPSPL